MTDAFLLDAYQAFLEKPTADNYRRVRRMVTAEPGFDRQSVAWMELAALCEEGRFDQLRERAWEMWPTWRLSPRFHLLVGYAANRLGDYEEEQLERFQFQTCLDGLLGTGEGTQQKPYQVLYVSDQYDVIRDLGLRGRGQRALEHNGRGMDVVWCEDGTQVWFDTGPLPYERQRSRRVTAWRERIPSRVLHHF